MRVSCRCNRLLWPLVILLLYLISRRILPSWASPQQRIHAHVRAARRQQIQTILRYVLQFFLAANLLTDEKKRNRSAPPSPPPKSNPILVPRGRTGEKKRSTTDRKKHPRLNGADLYVVRLGWQTGSGGGAVPCCDTLEQPKDFPAKQATGSLHEELLNAGPVAAPAVNVKVTSKSSKPEPTVLASRPCYRCVSYMDSVGIKRVFWTNSSGEWECAKVRDLVDALDDLGSGGVDAQTTLSSVFVTKHEVLMLRRSMGVEF